MYSASVVLMAICVYSLEFQMMGQSAKFTIYPVRDFAVLMS
jgi:hypothetical protein